MRVAVAFFLFAAAGLAQSTGGIFGAVADPGDASVAGATVRLQNPLTGFVREIVTGDDGAFQFGNLPLQTYTLTVTRDGFQPERQTISVASNIRIPVAVKLRLAAQAEVIKVTALDNLATVQPEVTGTRTELDAAAIERMPAPIGNRGLESMLLSFPGFAANANGAIHPRGAHNQMTFVIDGMPISDQLTGAFATGVDPSLVQSVELYTGNVPAEYGNKVSGVVNLTTRTGLGSGRRFSGSTQINAAQFDTLGQITQVTGGGDKVGYFASVNTLKSNRFLDQVSLDNLHNGGDSERGFARLDYQAGPRDALRLNMMSGRSSFQLANLRSQHAAGQAQRQLLRDASASLGWVRTIDARSTIDATASYRTSIAQLFPSTGDTPVTAAQARHLSTLTLAARYNRVQGAHTLRAGGDYQRFPVSENFSFGITDPAFNDPGRDDYIATLQAHDFTRGGTWFHFSRKQAGSLYSGFAQDLIRWGRFTFQLGARYDNYRFLVNGAQIQPRAGVAFHLRETGTVIRASYNRTYQTPPNENLLLSNSEEAAALSPADVRGALGSGIILIRPQRQNVYEVGVQQAAGSRLMLNGAFFHKDDRDLHDNDNFLNTGIIFPTSLRRARVNGAEFRANLLPIRGFSASVSATHYRAIVTPPFTGGLFLGSAAVDSLSAGPFIIDHDQTLGVQTNLQYNPRPGLWFSSAIRYDSGLVTNPSDPDDVRTDPDYADLLPYVNLDADPPRVRPRTLVDVAAGWQRPLDEKRKVELVLQVSNLFDRTALYNFQSIFVGTRLVQPRTAGLKLRFYW